MTKKPWSDFTGITSQSYVRDLLPKALDVEVNDLFDMQEYRREARVIACKGVDPIRVVVTYAQDELVYDAKGDISPERNRNAYLSLPRERRVNKFGLSYRRDARLYLQKTLADVTVDAAIYLYRTHGWSTVLYDGLRTVDGAYNLYLNAHDSDMSSGLLSLPGRSSHNKGLAIDSMMVEKSGREVDVGAHFDHLDMAVASRLCDSISETAKRNRVLRESAFMRAGFAHGILIAPLRAEFWHDQLPENREDLWRVLESAARCMGMELLTAEDELLRKQNRAAFEEKWERWSYADFLAEWQKLFRGHEAKLKELFGVTSPPPQEKIEFYHGNYHPVYDKQLACKRETSYRASRRLTSAASFSISSLTS